MTRLANCLCKCNILKVSANSTHHRPVDLDAQDNVELEDIYRQLRQTDESNIEDVNDTNEYNPSILGVFQPLQNNIDNT